MDEAGEAEIVTDNIDHEMVGKRISFRIFGGEAKSGTVTAARRDTTGMVFLTVSAEDGTYDIMETQVMTVEMDSKPEGE